MLTLFAKKDKITADVTRHFIEEKVTVNVREYTELVDGVDDLVKSTASGNILISTVASAAIYERIPKERLVQVFSPIALLKSVKNDVEAEGLRKAHIRDGVALIRYLHWLEENVDSGTVTELSGAAVVGGFRAEQENFKSLSFGALSAFGANAAIVHYSATEETNTLITRDEIYLIDSGGQYLYEV